MPSYKDFFERREREKKLREEEKRRREREAEEARRREEERKRREAEEEEKRRRQLREQFMRQVANRFDSTIKQILRDYGDVKIGTVLLGGKGVEGPSIGYSSACWALRCRGYEGVEVTLCFKENSRGELEPDKFTISGTWGGRHQATLSIEDLLDALADSYPKKYTPPSRDSGPSYTPCNMGIC